MFVNLPEFTCSTIGRLVALSTNIRLGWKGLSVTNTLAYYQHWQITAVKSFITSSPRANVLKLFSLELTSRPNKLECLSLASLFSLSNVCGYGQEATQDGGPFHSGRLQPYWQTLDWDGSLVRDKESSLFGPHHNVRRVKLYNIGTLCQCNTTLYFATYAAAK
jgi:hypothetical protein